MKGNPAVGVKRVVTDWISFAFSACSERAEREEALKDTVQIVRILVVTLCCSFVLLGLLYR